MATTITAVKPTFGETLDEITIIGTGFTDAPSLSKVYKRKHGDTVWDVVTGANVAYVSGTELTVTLETADAWDAGLNDIGVSDSVDETPDASLAQALYVYLAGVNDPDNFIKGAPYAVYVGGGYLGQTHGGLDLEHSVDTSDIESDQSLIPLRTIKNKEGFQLTVPLGEVSLDNLKQVWGIGAAIVDNPDGTRVLTFGGDVDLAEQEVLLILPAGSGKRWAVTFYRCAVVSPGTLKWSRDDQVDLPLQIKILADTSRAIGDQVGRVYEYTES